MMLGIDGLTERRLLNALDSLERLDSEKLQRDIFENVLSEYDVNNSGIIYDVTNTYLYGKKCELGKLGKDKEGVKGRPLIQVGLGVTEEDGIPIFHKTFDGNIHDSRTLQDLITTFRRYEIKKSKSGFFVIDRGITSAKNVTDITNMGWDVIGGVPINEKLKKFWKEDLEQDRPINNRVVLNKTKFYITCKPYELGKTEGYLYLCFNPQQRIDLMESRRDV